MRNSWQDVVERGLSLLDEHDSDARTRMMLSNLLSLVGADVAGEIEIDLAAGFARVRCEVPDVLLTPAAGMEAVLGSHPILPLLRSRSDVPYGRASDVVGADTWARNTFHQELLRPAGLPYALFGAYWATPTLVRGWGVNRGREFRDSEVGVVRRFEPFLRRAASARDLDEARTELQEVLLPGLGVLVIDQFRISDVDRQATELLSRHGVPPQRVQATALGQGEEVRVISTKSGHLRIRCQRTPSGREIVLINEVDADGGDVPASHRLLTSRQVEVLQVMEEGLTSSAAGRQLGISSRTVEKHLEAAYRELDVTDRLSAVLMARKLGLLA